MGKDTIHSNETTMTSTTPAISPPAIATVTPLTCGSNENNNSTDCGKDHQPTMTSKQHHHHHHHISLKALHPHHGHVHHPPRRNSSSSIECESPVLAGERDHRAAAALKCSLPNDNWSGETEKFKLRSKSYLHDKRKNVCEECMFDLIAMDLLEVDKHVPDVSKNLKGGVAHTYLSRPDPKPFLFVVHFLLPGDKNLAFVAYFAAKPGVLEADTPFAKLFKDFINGTDEFRQSRFKFIPTVSKGPFLVKSMVGSTPAILGNKLTQTYHSGEGYFEVCVDVGSSTVGGSLLKLVKGYLTTLTFDMCFVLEAQKEEELPEVSLATARFANLDLKMAQKFVAE